MLRQSSRRWRTRQIVHLVLAISIPLTAFLIRGSLGSFGATPTLAQGTRAPLDLFWNAPNVATTNALAWGDVNGDGDLDLAVGNDGLSRIYRNCALASPDDGCVPGARFVPDATWTPPAAATNAVAWGDLDRDGDLDLVLANKNSRAQIFFNTGTGLPSSPSAASIIVDPTGLTVITSIAIGDLNGAGGPDILLGVNGAPSRIYVNSGSGTFSQSDWTPSAANTQGVALGDLNADGRLDLVLANTASATQSSQIYLNSATGLSPTAQIIANTSSLAVTSVAIGDLDGQPGMDILLGVNGSPSRIYLNVGSGTFSQGSWTPIAAATFGVALGDADRDGDLDLVLGNADRASQLYRNSGTGGFTLDSDWSPSASNQATAVAWGDADGDGNLDLAMGNKNQVSQIYRNAGAALTLASTLTGEEMAGQRQVALADVNNDGYFDLGLANAGIDPSFPSNSQIYLNDRSGRFTSPSWTSDPANANALAWGDVDNDGDLDLVLGVGGDSSQLYRNDSTTGSVMLSRISTWSPPSANTNAVAWGDLDNNGWIDLVLGNTAEASQIYLNTSGTLSPTAITINPTSPISTTTSVALGDLNNDGDLDLVLGNAGTYGDLLYRNCTYPDKDVTCSAGALFVQDASFRPAPFNTTSVALGDLNGDGMLDLAVGNLGNPNQIYWNDGYGRLILDTTWLPTSANTNRVALGDMDGDQDLDILFSNQGYASQVYRNDGAKQLTLLPASATLGQTNAPATPAIFATTTGSAWGDLNGDGSLDMVLANLNQPSQIYLNGTGGIATPIDHAPTLRIRQPTASGQPGPAGSLFSTGQTINSTTISFTYTLSDLENDQVGLVRGFFSLDGGGTWQQAVPISTTQTPTRNIGPGEHVFSWDVFSSSFFGQSDSVLFQLRAYPLPVPNGTFDAPQRASGPYQQPFVSATTTLFRARGRQVQVLKGATGTTPAPGALVYRVPTGQERGSLLTSADGQPFSTDASGYLSGRATLNPQDRLAALMPVALPDNSELKSKVALYSTSPISTTSGLPNDVVQRGSSGIQVLRVDSAHPLVLFNLTVGLEWDASNDPQYLSQLLYNLRRASELLYDWTDGQAALGQLTLTYGVDTVENADIRIYATNRLRPWAYQGGVVSSPYTDTLSLSKTIIYSPGYLSMGSVWSRYGDSVSFGDDWPRALAHEIGHYALFLDDNYIGRDGSELISVSGCKGAMSNPYRDDYTEFHPNQNWTPDCAQTLSNVETGRSDWATIKRFYDSSAPGFTLTAPQSFNANPGPFAQALNFTQISLPTSTVPSAALSAPVFSLVRVPDRSKPYLTESYSYAPGSRVRAVLYTSEGRLIDLGRPNMDQLFARGAKIGDTICVYDSTSLVAGCTTVATGIAQIKLYDQTGWQPDIQINPLSPTQIEVVVAASSVAQAIPGATTLRAQFFNKTLPNNDNTPFNLILDPGGSTYQAILTVSQPVYGGYLRVGTTADPAAAGWYESITEYQLNGTPAVVANGFAAVVPTSPPAPYQCQPPLCHPSPTPRKSHAPIAASNDGQLLVYGDTLTAGQFYSLQTANRLPPAPPWSILVGQAYRLYTQMTDADLRAKRVAVTAAYLESEMPAGTEGGLAIYYAQDGTTWKRLKTARFDPDKNEVSAAAVGSGLYALISRIEVSPGWNNISYPWPGTFDLLSATQKLNITPRQHFTTIHSYDPQDTGNPWKVYDVDVPAWVHDLTKLSYGKGYWFIVPPNGGTPAQLTGAATLDSGIPVPPATFYGVLPYHGAPAQAGLPVQAISGGVVCSTAQTFTPKDTQAFAFLIEVLPAGQGAPVGCGIMNQPVTITVGGQVIGQMIWDNSRPMTFHDLFIPLVSLAAPTLSSSSEANFAIEHT